MDSTHHFYAVSMVISGVYGSSLKNFYRTVVK